MQKVHRNGQPQLGDFENALKGMAHIARGDFFIVFFFQGLLDFIGLLLGQPTGLGGFVREFFPDHHRKQHRRDAFQKEQPLPAMPAHDAVHFQQEPANRAADDVGQAHADQKVTAGPRSLFLAEPIGEVQHHARKQPRFRSAQQGAGDVKSRLVGDKSHARRQDAPGDHDPGDPQPCAHAVHDQVAGHFHQGISEEEQPGAKTVGRRGDPQIDGHVGFGQRNIGPVQKADDVSKNQHRH